MAAYKNNMKIFKIDLSITLGIIFISLLPIVIIADIFNLLTISFISETLIVTVYPLIIIYFISKYISDFFDLSKNIIPTCFIILIGFSIFFYFVHDEFIPRYKDFPNAILMNYSKTSGTVEHFQIFYFLKHTEARFQINNINFKIDYHDYNKIAKEMEIFRNYQYQIIYLKHSKFVIDIKNVEFL